MGWSREVWLLAWNGGREVWSVAWNGGREVGQWHGMETFEEGAANEGN